MGLAVSGAVEVAGASAPRLRLVRLEGFCPVARPAQDDGRYERRFTTLFADEASCRSGGVAEVMRVQSPMGEQFALKRLRLSQPGLSEGMEQLLRDAFDAEFDTHQRLSELKGFPRLYGRATVEGCPVILMEWIEGITLQQAARQLAVDDEGRLSPLTAARLGRDLFELLARMSYVEGGLAHRDVSLRNVMVDASRVPLVDQAEEGAFELRLVDFGSAAIWEEGDSSLTGRYGGARGATADFAPPEMLTDDVAEVAQLRHSPAVDVYAAASVVYALLEGRPPYDLSFAAREQQGQRSAYRIKTELAFAPFEGAHAAAADMAAVLAREPEVAVAVGQEAAALETAPSSGKVRTALCAVDQLLEQPISRCLAPQQPLRPSAAAMRDALGQFCDSYRQNIGRALRGQPLVECAIGQDERSRRAARRRRLSRGLVTAVSAAVLLAVTASAALLANGMAAAFPVPSGQWEGSMPGAAVAAVLLLPAAAGLLARAVSGKRGLAGPLLAALGGLAVSAVLMALVQWPSAAVAGALWAALAVAAAAPLCGFAATALFSPEAAAERAAEAAPKRPVLAWGADPAPLLGLEAPAAALPEAGLPEAAADEPPTYEPDPDSDPAPCSEEVLIAEVCEETA